MNNTTLSQLDIEEIIKDFPVKPRFSKVIITLNKDITEGDLQLETNILSDIQYVVAKGGSVNEVNVGNKVIIDIEKLMVPMKTEPTNAYETQMQVKIDPIIVDGITYAIVEDRVIKAIDNR